MAWLMGGLGGFTIVSTSVAVLSSDPAEEDVRVLVVFVLSSLFATLFVVVLLGCLSSLTDLSAKRLRLNLLTAEPDDST